MVALAEERAIAVPTMAKVIPPVVLIIRRAVDKWLATWSRADEVLVHPLDPITAAETVARVLRRSAPVVPYP